MDLESVVCFLLFMLPFLALIMLIVFNAFLPVLVLPFALSCVVVWCAALVVYGVRV